MTPSEEELQNKQNKRERPSHPKSLSGTMKPFQTNSHRLRDTLPSAGEGHEEPPTRVRGSSSKLRRAFSLNSYRNPFVAKSHTLDTSVSVEERAAATDTMAAGQDAKRRVSWRKFLVKLASQFGSNFIVSVCAMISFSLPPIYLHSRPGVLCNLFPDGHIAICNSIMLPKYRTICK